MYNPYDSALREGGPHPEAPLIVFAAFFLENYHLFTIAYGFYDGLNKGSGHIGAANKTVGLGADERNGFKGDLHEGRGTV
jgi:hypothetical protein